MPSYSLLAGLVDLGVVAAGVEPDVALSVLLLALVPELEVLLVPALSVL